MFLATTGLTEFWDTNEEILCLGAWCLRYDRRHVWERARYRVLPSPWEEERRFSDAAAYVEGAYERLLPALTEYLNRAHGVSYSATYWRILLGPWLIHFLHGTYDRYAHLREALTIHPVVRTIVLDPRSFQTPSDIAACAAWMSDDPYNLQIFSQFLHEMGYRFPARRLDAPWTPPTARPAAPWWRRAARTGRTLGLTLAEQTAGRLQPARAAVLCEMHASPVALWTLAWRSRLRAIPRQITWDGPFAESAPVMDERRQGLARLPASDAFERVFVRLLPQHLPTLYLEGYREAREATVRNSPRSAPAVLASAAGWHFKESFKFLAAEASERGSRLVAVQHGGGYGLYRHAPMERHERRIASSFLVWGWANGSADHLRNVPSLTLSRVRGARRHPRRLQTILFVSTAHLRYLLRFHSSPIGLPTEHYFQWQLRFLEALPDRLRQALRFRAYPVDYGHGTLERLTARLGRIQCDAARSFHDALRQARLVIVDHSGTTFLEVLQFGRPTVLFWDPARSVARPEAEPFLAKLRTAGILWDAPEAAARHVEAVYDQAEAWWNREPVQTARTQFVERYALGRSDWAEAWTRALHEELANA